MRSFDNYANLNTIKRAKAKEAARALPLRKMSLWRSYLSSYHLLETIIELEELEKSATRENIKQINRMLVCKEFFTNTDRSTRCKLLLIARKIGDESTINALQKFAIKAKEIPYVEKPTDGTYTKKRMQEEDQWLVNDTIKDIKRRIKKSSR